MSYDVSRDLWNAGFKGDYEPEPEVAELAALVERIGVTRTSHRPAEQRAGDLKLLRHCIDNLELSFAHMAADFAATEEFELYGSVSAADWVRHNCKMSGVAAGAAIRVGEQMPSLPESVAAVRDGEIGYAHLSLLARTSAAVKEPGGADAFDERPLLQQAREHSVGRFSHDCHHARHAADAAGFLSDHLTAVEWRAFEMSPCEGGVVLRGRLDSVGAATLRSALEPLAKRQGAEDTRGRRRRFADALVELGNHGLDSGELPSQAGQRPHVQVTTTLETLMGVCGAPAGEMQFSEPISIATVQRLACDSGVTRILLDSKSAIINVGRSKRVPSAPMRRALHARDQGCVWPGCERPPSWTAAHHIKHWARDDGLTELPNLGSLCYRHHELVHEGGWDLAWSEDGRLLTIPPPPTWAIPRGERAPTEADEAADLARREQVERDVQGLCETSVAARKRSASDPVANLAAHISDDVRS